MVAKTPLSTTILSTRLSRVLSHVTTKLTKYVTTNLEKDIEIFRHSGIYYERILVPTVQKILRDLCYSFHQYFQFNHLNLIK